MTKRWVLFMMIVVSGFNAGTIAEEAVNAGHALLRQAELQAAVAAGLAYLKEQAEADDDAWVFPPRRQTTVTGHREVEVRYRREMVEQPVYEYEEYEVYQNVRQGDSVDAVTVRQKVKRRRPVKKIGTREVERLVRDPNGTIVRTERRAIRAPGGPDFWQGNKFGHNALSIYVRARLGATAEDPTVERAAEQLHAIFNTFGLPDLTWDLAWLTAAFSLLDGRDYQDMARRAAAKLADGQIRDGQAAGFWGPVSINRQLLAETMALHSQLSTEYLTAKEQAEKRGRRTDEAAAEAALTALQEFNAGMSRITMLGQNPRQVLGSVQLSDDAHPSITVTAFPEYIYNQISADIESTAVALFALRVAATHGTLPQETVSPVGPNNRPLVRPEPIVTILNRAAQAIERAQQPNGAWHECNMHQPVTFFDRQTTLAGIPVNRRSFPALHSDINLASVARGYGALIQTGHMLGFDRMGAYSRNFVAGDQVLRSAFQEVAAQAFTDHVGGQVPPYDAFVFLAELPPIPYEEPPPDIHGPALNYVLENQAENGSWLTYSKVSYFISTSYAARIKSLPALSDRRRLERNAPAELAQAHVAVNEATDKWENVLRSSLVFSRRDLSTCMALLYLAIVQEQQP